ncbi:MAG: sigma-70 family RNA polymerase sigma factor [Thermoleophilaceae bacterium]|nr:sigma-70 family RNA polymerase sigma factor [Thermoleophilaceae bacterium]
MATTARIGQPRREPAIAPRPRRLLALASDDRLAEWVKRGNETALEVVYQRHGRAILAFCRHMLGSREEAEEVVQHVFTAAWSDLQRNERPVHLKPWLYTVARNRCLSLLRARRPVATPLDDSVATEGLADEVQRRSDLRELLADVRDLPEEQRAALVLTELDGVPHAQIAQILGRKEADVKALVFRARSNLAEWRQARETPCDRVREELSVLRGGSLRRTWLRRHLQSCESCREFRLQVKVQRGMMAIVLPVTPSMGLEKLALGAASSGGAAGGLGALASGSTTVAKVAAAAALAGGAVSTGEQAIHQPQKQPSVPSAVQPEARQPQRATPSHTSMTKPTLALPPSGALLRDMRQAARERRGHAAGSRGLTPAVGNRPPAAASPRRPQQPGRAKQPKTSRAAAPKGDLARGVALGRRTQSDSAAPKGVPPQSVGGRQPPSAGPTGAPPGKPPKP